MQKILFIIPGAAPLSSSWHPLQQAILFSYKYFFSFHPQYTTKNGWAKSFVGTSFEIFPLQWSRKVWSHDLKKTVDALTKNLQKHTEREIYFLAESIGTEIALRAIEQLPDLSYKILVALCPVSRPRKFLNIQAFFLRSQQDRFARVANTLFWPQSLWKKNDGRLKIIHLPLRHDQFEPEQEIKKEGKIQSLATFVKTLYSL